MANLRSQYRRLFEGRSSSNDRALLREEIRKVMREDDANASELPEAWIEANKDDYEGVIDGIVSHAWDQLSDLSFTSWAEDEGHEYPSAEEEEYLKNKIMKRVLKELV